MASNDPATRTDLVIDIGNSRAKLGLFNAGRIRHAPVATGDTAGVRSFLGNVTPHRIAVGSVAGDPIWIAELQRIAPVHELTGASPSPLTTAYDAPLTLGVDRLANAVAAHSLFPLRTVLAIDLGSCITYDVVTPQAVHLGGAISPGAHMRARAMNAYSARLPMLDPFTPSDGLGKSTVTSLATGIQSGVQHELAGWIAALRQQHADLAVVLTGGDAPRFARALKSGIFAVPLLTLVGLHVLLDHTNSPDGPAGRRGVRPAGQGTER